MHLTESDPICRWVCHICRFATGAVLLVTAWFKLDADPQSVTVFSQLNMEPAGRYVIGMLECAAAVALFFRSGALLGALGAIALMTGATIAHLTVLGYKKEGYLMMQLVALGVLLCSLFIVLVLREHVPMLGRLILKKRK